MRSSRYVPFLTLGFLVLMWGYSWVPGKLGIAYTSAFVWAGIRSFPAYLLLFGLLLVLRRPLRPKALGLTALVGVLQVGGFVGFTSAALVTAGAAHTALLANTWQFLILIPAWLVLGERVRGLQWLAIAVGMVGLVLVIEPQNVHGVMSGLFAFAAAVCFAAGAVAAKVLRQRHQVDLLSLTAWQGLLGSLPLVVLAAFFHGEGIRWSATFIWSLGYSMLIGTALATLVWLQVLSLVPASIAGIGNLATPMVGVLASWLQLGEHLSRSEIAGIVLVAVALGLLAARGLQGARREAAAIEPNLKGMAGDRPDGLSAHGADS